MHEYNNRTFKPGQSKTNTLTTVQHANVVQAKKDAEAIAMRAWLASQDYHGKMVKIAALAAQGKTVELPDVIGLQRTTGDQKKVGKWVIYISQLFGLTIHKRANIKPTPIPIPNLIDLTTLEIKVGMITKIYDSCSDVAVNRDDFYYKWELNSTEIGKMATYVIKECTRQCFDQYMHLKKGNDPDKVYALFKTLSDHETNGRFPDSIKTANSKIPD